MSEMIRQEIPNVVDGDQPATRVRHKLYCLSHNLLGFMPYVKEYNGFVDSRQVIIWYVVENDIDVEIARSEGGDFKTTTRFKELALQILQEQL